MMWYPAGGGPLGGAAAQTIRTGPRLMGYSPPPPPVPFVEIAPTPSQTQLDGAPLATAYDRCWGGIVTGCAAITDIECIGGGGGASYTYVTVPGGPAMSCAPT
mmetsp:Transcript_17625/g.45537  ORF Transcript_17625/g.45537 Transcript_17625/m.45537 type:complete len:103 (-) Transcript_17625:251-559(-)